MLKDHHGVSDEGELSMGGLNMVDLAEEYGTPLYVIDAERIRNNYRNFFEAFSKRWSDVSVWYAYKANYNKAVCKVLQDEGCGAEVGSLCELRVALDIGIPGKDIILNGNNKSESELKLAIQNEVHINVDNIDELKLVDRISKELGKTARIGFRVNPDVKAPTHPHISTGLRESKFGLDVPSGKALKAYEMASKKNNVSIESIHSHIGSQILDPNPFAEQAGKMIKLRSKVKEVTGVEIEMVDLGGGLGIPYEPEEDPLNPGELANNLVSAVEEALRETGDTDPKLVFEPGRFLVADSGLLLGKVGHRKSREGFPDWISIDVGMNGLVRPAMYGSYHHIEVANKMDKEKTGVFNIAGPLCESGDYLGKDRDLPDVEVGDILAVYDVGAYGLSMSSQYNGKPRPAMVMIENGKAHIVRKREKCEDVIGMDQLPGWLK
ncbi:MAG: diaminopimelate decarboxylase [Candidatus Hadarchaeota archaeon]